MRGPFILIILLVLCSLTQAQTKDKAPLPIAMLEATKVFVVNAGADAEFFDVFYSELKAWGKYDLVGKPAEAELIFEFSYGSQGEAPQVHTNPANLRTYSYVTYKTSLAVREAKSRDLLWSNTQPTGGSMGKKKNQEKAVKRLLDDLKSRKKPEQK